MTGIGKPRSKFGDWLDQRGITQQWVVKNSGLNKNTVSKLAAEDKPPTVETMKRVLEVLRTIDPELKVNDFWDI